jgi:hypothetical protein
MHNIYDIKSICSQMYLNLKCSVKWGTQNTQFKVINQHKNDMCHVQSLKKVFYL